MLEAAENIASFDGIEVKKRFLYGGENSAGTNGDVEMKDCSEVYTNSSPEIVSNAHK